MRMVQRGKNQGEEREPLKVGQIDSSGRKKTELPGLNIQRIDLPFVLAGVLMFTFLVAFVISSFIIQPLNGKAVNGLGLADAASMALDVSIGSVDMQITPVSGGTLVSGSHDLIATTNVPTGYKLSLEATTSAGNPTPSLTPTGGTVVSPTPLDNNTWGYALASTSAVGVVNDFDTSYATPIPSPGSKWANPLIFATVKNTSTAATGDKTTIYYGARADMAAAAGVHSSVATYTATANTSNILTPSILSITPTYGEMAGGTAIVIVGTGFTLNDTSITTGVTIGGQNCRNVSISSNAPITGRDTIYCNTPASSAGAKDVVVNTWGGTATKVGGFTYVAPANVTFVSPSNASTIAGIESGPTFTIVGSGFIGATAVSIGGIDCEDFTIVNDNHIVCRGPKSGQSAGPRAVIVSKNGIHSGENTIVTYRSDNYPTFQAANVFAACSSTAQIFRDTRDSQLYYVKKMADGKCWMVDNLKYAGFGKLSQVNGKYLTNDGSYTHNAVNLDIGKWVDPGASAYCTGTTGMPANTNTHCGLLYNWYAATAGTGTYGFGTNGNQASASICPANFRLPSSASRADSPIANGQDMAAADFPVLNASMNAGSLMPGNIDNTFSGWQPTGAWGGVFSGVWSDILDLTGSNGLFWSSTAVTNDSSRMLQFTSSSVSLNKGASKSNGYAVRCVMENPAPKPPAGANPPNISSTNPAVLDVYPTTGWGGDTVAITSNALFTNVTNITIGGTACTSWGVITASLATCVLPAKVSGTSNDIAVTNNGVNVTPTSTYTHMKITYFNPNSSTVNISGTNYNFYANKFTSANCAAMTANNNPIASTPAASMAYVRDNRNNQTYKVKKMVDNKCWMVDNIKFIDAAVFNTADGSVGMVYNQGDHLNNGGTDAHNTVDESDSQSSANSDKAFYANPMFHSYCYGTNNMPVKTLTHCGYIYNWYAATAGTGKYGESVGGKQVKGSICPSGFRLPTATSDGLTPTSDGTSYSAADIAVLNASMRAGTLNTGNAAVNFYAQWLPSGAWGAALSGHRPGAWGGQGNSSDLWSSTVSSNEKARGYAFRDGYVNAGTVSWSKWGTFAVRCVLD